MLKFVRNCQTVDSWVCVSTIKEPAGLVSGEGSLPVLQMAASSLCPHLAVCACTLLVSPLLLRAVAANRCPQTTSGREIQKVDNRCLRGDQSYWTRTPPF